MSLIFSAFKAICDLTIDKKYFHLEKRDYKNQLRFILCNMKVFFHLNEFFINIPFGSETI